MEVRTEPTTPVAPSRFPFSVWPKFVCFFRNHEAWPDYEAFVWRCDRCGASGPKLWMTGAWFVTDIRRRLRNDIPF